MDELELEQAMREGLQRRAEDVDTSAPWWSGRVRRAASPRAGGVDRAGGRLGRGRGRDRSGRGGSGGDEPGRGEPGRSTGRSRCPSEWRTEYWHDMPVDVPADWGYGGAPMDDGTDEIVACWRDGHGRRRREVGWER